MKVSDDKPISSDPKDIKTMETKIASLGLWPDEEGVESRNNIVASIVSTGTMEAMRILIKQWTRWIASGNDISLAYSTAQQIKINSESVRPLIERLEKPFEGRIKWNDLELWKSIIYEVAFDAGEDQVELYKAYEDNKMDLYESRYSEKIKQTWEAKQLDVRKQIAQLLADMSSRVKSDVWESYAIPQLSHLLARETDLDIRECMARILGNIRSDKAVEAMVSALTGQDQRFNILDKYYLQPSQKRGEYATHVLNDLINKAKATLVMTQWMNVAVFVIGLLVLGVGLVGGLFADNIGTRLAAVVAGLGGITGVVFYLVRDPLNRIQNSMSNLAQVETAFNSYIWELNLSDTYIQSQYLAHGLLTEDEIAQTSERVNGVSSATLNQIESYTEEGKAVQVGYINSISPSVGQEGSEITIYGRFYTLDNDQKTKGQVMAYSHKEKLADLTSINVDEVRFTLPSGILSSDAKETTLWVSVVTDQGETNAVPFPVTKKTG